jgi:hypothetical protein
MLSAPSARMPRDSACALLRAQGLRLIQIRVPDVRAPGFAEAKQGRTGNRWRSPAREGGSGLHRRRLRP